MPKTRVKEPIVVLKTHLVWKSPIVGLKTHTLYGRAHIVVLKTAKNPHLTWKSPLWCLKPVPSLEELLQC